MLVRNHLTFQLATGRPLERIARSIALGLIDVDDGLFSVAADLVHGDRRKRNGGSGQV